MVFYSFHLNQPQNSVTDLDDRFDTNSISTVDETNQSSTNSIITEVNNGFIADDDFSEHSISNSVDESDVQQIHGLMINGQSDDGDHIEEKEV